MSITTTTHLNFTGQAREALGFYRSVFGGELVVATYADMGMPADLPGADGVVFGQVVSEGGFRVMAYDVPVHGRQDMPAPSTRRQDGLTLTGERFFVSVRGGTAEEVAALWAGLAEGATVLEEFAPSAWSPGFGMLTDRFGVTWVLDVAAPYAG